MATEGGTIDALGTGHTTFWSRYKLPILYILPAAVVLAVVTLYPIAYQVYLSFTDFSLRDLRSGEADWIG